MAQLNRGRVSDPAQAASSGSHWKAPGSAGGYLLSAILSTHLPLYPDLRLRMESMFALDLAHSVLAAELDLAIIAEPSESPHLTLVQLASVPLYVAMQADHPAAKRRSVSIEEFGDVGWMIFPRKAHPAIYDRILDASRQAAVSPVELHHYVAPQEAVQRITENFGIAFKAKGVAEQIRNPEIAVRPMSEVAPQITSYLVLRADQSSRLVNEFGRAFLRKVLPNSKIEDASGQLSLAHAAIGRLRRLFGGSKSLSGHHHYTSAYPNCWPYAPTSGLKPPVTPGEPQRFQLPHRLAGRPCAVWPGGFRVPGEEFSYSSLNQFMADSFESDLAGSLNRRHLRQVEIARRPVNVASSTPLLHYRRMFTAAAPSANWEKIWVQSSSPRKAVGRRVLSGTTIVSPGFSLSSANRLPHGPLTLWRLTTDPSARITKMWPRSASRSGPPASSRYLPAEP